MKSPLKLSAIDMGASSGRCMMGSFDGKRIAIEELFRYDNEPAQLNGTIYWNILGIWNNLKRALQAASARGALQSVSVDTWGSDIALLQKDGDLVENPVCYRDPATSAMRSFVNSHFTREEIYRRVGVDNINSPTVMRLSFLREHRPETLEACERFCFLPDYFNYLLSGVRHCEYTIATTSQMMSPASGDWDDDIVNALGLPKRLFPEIGASGVFLGDMRRGLCDELGLKPARVYATCGHDSAAAIAAVPATDDRWLNISSGTWSILGCESGHRVIPNDDRAFDFVHEGCYGKTNRFVNNMVGLWLAQETRRCLRLAGNTMSFGELERAAESAPPFKSFIVPGHIPGMLYGDMPKSIREYCLSTSQPVPETAGELIRCIYDSLAFNYALVLSEMEKLLGYEFSRIHIVGGGAQSRLLSRLTSNAANKPVCAGPVEASTLGNLLVQLIAAGEIKDIPQARRLVADSFDIENFAPVADERTLEAKSRFEKLFARRAPFVQY